MDLKTIEELFQKKSPLEHILLRPDTYVGSIEHTRASLWVVNETQQFEKLEIEYVPALYKIFDEVLVNAADNYQRDQSMNSIKIVVDVKEGFIEVTNNGQGIPVVIHKVYSIYVPELIFGHLLTGTNYNDQEKKVVGGRNGYGAKLANIFSKRFSVEAADGKRGLKFFMEWTKNMSQHSEARVSKHSGSDFTCVRFYPDFKLFKIEGLRQIEGLLKKRAYDLAGIFGGKVKVHYNGAQIAVRSFEDYVRLYIKGEDPLVVEKDCSSERWQVMASFSDGEFNQVSFVNGICTSRGGTHVNYIIEQVVSKIQEQIAKKSKDLNVKPHQIKQHLWIFVNCLIENPSFDSQTKETLVTKASQFGSSPELSEKFIKAILKSGVVESIINEAKARELSKMSKTTAGGKKAKISGIPKLDDANDAGSRNSEKCTLILTEGDSAKGLAMAGIEIVGRDHFGVFPLRGKLLNVREASNKQIMENQEIQNLIRILGLQIGKQYEDTKSLRYGSVMIMTDQDTDGSHIKGLILNFVHSFWPSLFKLNGFLKEFITPILKASRGPEVKSFFSVQDFKHWAEGVDLRRWHIKYYKGLGTSTDKEAQEYFNDIERHRLEFEYRDREDDESIDLVFNKKKADQRKQWLEGYDLSKNVDYRVKKLRYKTFINEEFIHFSILDNMRSIPSLVDGLKPGQRKIIYACFKRNLRQEIKVAQLIGYVAEHSAYHHGEASLSETIVNMAQDFVGSNNVNLLQPLGQFGSRNQGGKEHASARYIFTNLSKTTRYLFPEPDDHTLTYLEDDGQLVEPMWYIPILPLSLINGAQGIGSGWSTYIPCYNPRQIARWILGKLQGAPPASPLRPWYKGFTGAIEESQKGYVCKGVYNVKEEGVLQIRELPIRKWTKDYKMFLDKLADEDDPDVSDIREYHTKNRVHFQVQFAEGVIQKWEERGTTAKNLKLVSSIPMTNCVLFNKDCKLKRYSAIEDILNQFYQLRLEYYQKRKDYLLSRLERELKVLDNKARFIQQVVEQIIVIRNVKKKQLCQLLVHRGYTPYSRMPVIKSTKLHKRPEDEQQPADAQAEVPTKGKKKGAKQERIPPKAVKTAEAKAAQTVVEQGDSRAKDFDYLLRMPLWSLTFEEVQKLIQEKVAKTDEYKTVANTALKDMWKSDIQAFLQVLDQVEEEEQRQRLKALEKAKNANNKSKKPTKKQLRKKKEPVKSEADRDSVKSGGSSKKKGGEGRRKGSQKKEGSTKGSKGRRKDSKRSESRGKKTRSEVSEMDVSDLIAEIKGKTHKLQFQIGRKAGGEERVIREEANEESLPPMRERKIRRQVTNSDDEDDYRP